MKLLDALHKAVREGLKLKRESWKDWHWYSGGQLHTDTVGGSKIMAPKNKPLSIEDCFAEDWEVGPMPREFWIGIPLDQSVYSTVSRVPLKNERRCELSGELLLEFEEIVHVREVLP